MVNDKQKTRSDKRRRMLLRQAGFQVGGAMFRKKSGSVNEISKMFDILLIHREKPATQLIVTDYVNNVTDP